MMSDCWHTDPKMRPSFSDLADKLGETLIEGDKEVCDKLECFETVKNIFMFILNCIRIVREKISQNITVI